MSKGKKRSGARPGRPQPLRGTKGKRFFFNDTAATEIYTLSLHDALPILIVIRPHRNNLWHIFTNSSHNGIRCS